MRLPMHRMQPHVVPQISEGSSSASYMNALEAVTNPFSNSEQILDNLDVDQEIKLAIVSLGY